MADTKNMLNQLETKLEEIFGKQAPQIPENIKEIIVKIAPYLAIVGILFAIPALLLLLGLGSIATVVSPMGGVSSLAAVPTMWLSTLLLIPVIVLEALAIPGLFAKTKAGWRYSYWSQLVSVISSLIAFNILGAIFGAAIGFYILFQIKNHYK